MQERKAQGFNTPTSVTSRRNSSYNAEESDVRRMVRPGQVFAVRPQFTFSKSGEGYQLSHPIESGKEILPKKTSLNFSYVLTSTGLPLSSLRQSPGLNISLIAFPASPIRASSRPWLNPMLRSSSSTRKLLPTPSPSSTRPSKVRRPEQSHYRLSAPAPPFFDAVIKSIFIEGQTQTMEMDDVEPVRVADHRPPESYYLLLPILRRRLEEHLHRGPDTDNGTK
jgi:hypothetical protein